MSEDTTTIPSATVVARPGATKTATDKPRGPMSLYSRLEHEVALLAGGSGDHEWACSARGDGTWLANATADGFSVTGRPCASADEAIRSLLAKVLWAKELSK